MHALIVIALVAGIFIALLIIALLAYVWYLLIQAKILINKIHKGTEALIDEVKDIATQSNGGKVRPRNLLAFIAALIFNNRKKSSTK